VTEAGQPWTFQDILASGERLPLERALALVRAAVRAVDAVHARSAIHGSISPSSFQIDGDDRVTLQPPDGGQFAGDDLAPAREYWSPQRHAGEPARRADDLYALGLIANALLTGRRPTDLQSNAPTLPVGRTADPGALVRFPESTVPAEIAAVLRAQLSWAPSERFATGAELARELDRAAERALEPPAGTFPPLPLGEGWGEGSPSLPRTGVTRVLGEGAPPGDSAHPRDQEPAWAAARRVAQARAARRLALAELPDRGIRERALPIAYHPIQHRDYPDFPLPGGWVAVLVVVLCSVYLFPLYFMLFPHG
jgi:serine/threonine protein kinase